MQRRLRCIIIFVSSVSCNPAPVYAFPLYSLSLSLSLSRLSVDPLFFAHILAVDRLPGPSRYAFRSCLDAG